MGDQSSFASLLPLLGPTATMCSAFLGFLGGTLINHWLTQNRADRERHDRQIDICQGLLGELHVNANYVSGFQELVRLGTSEMYGPYIGSIETPVTRYYDRVQGDLGFLGWDVLMEIHASYANLLALSAEAIAQTKKAPLNPGGRPVWGPPLQQEINAWLDEHHWINDKLMAFQRPLLRKKDQKAWDKVDNKNAMSCAQPKHGAHREAKAQKEAA